MNNYNIHCLQPAAAATGGGSALNDLVDLNFGGDMLDQNLSPPISMWGFR